MSIEYRSTFDAEKLKREMLAAQKLALEKQLEEEVREIHKRTLSGRAADGSAFEKYTDAYAAWKSGFTRGGVRRRKTILSGKRAGKTRAVKINFGAGGNVNLTLSGQMLGNMTSKVVRIAGGFLGKIYFTSAVQAAKAKGNMEKRKFFDLSREQIKRIVDCIRNAKA